MPEAPASARERVLAMQRTAGNQATARLLRSVLARDEFKWGSKAGEADLPYPAEAGAAATLPPPVHAYYFPGVTERRALIIGGVHGSEPQGVAVVESLRAELTKRSAAGKPPYFTVILVPKLIARTHESKLPKVKDRRYVPRAPGDSAAEVNKTGIEPNRTFPMPGEDYADARKRATGGDSELKFDPPGKEGPRKPKGDHATDTILPENRVLIQLIERFKPERIASVHAHFLDPGVEAKPGVEGQPAKDGKPAVKARPEVKGRDPGTGRPGNDPGVFVDPRKGTAAEIAEDDRLATEMLHHAQKRAPATLQGGAQDPFMGNVGGKKRFNETVHYDPAAAGVEGTSLGDWAPVKTPTRGAITTITVEIPQYAGTGVSDVDAKAVEEAHRDALLEIFLGPPPTSPSP
ncbi:hypothetical protein [Solirubrobacter soli]|uniref:hypothetical protein n=1 Tax=Solirubrobacter soli TaxID=363832 RepID=UPI0004258846|nr:hypothetical protein [Solirubrobacter soli]